MKIYRDYLGTTDGHCISIGQGKFCLPLFRGNVIANRVTFTTPHIVKEIQPQKLDSIYRHPRNTNQSGATGVQLPAATVMVPETLEAW